MIEHYENYSVDYDYKSGEAVCNFKIYEKYGDAKEGPLFNKNVEGCDEGVSIEEADVWCKGFIKWDGCGHWTFLDNYMHLCGIFHVNNFRDILLRVHDKCGEIIQEGGINLLEGEFSFNKEEVCRKNCHNLIC